jgi:tRNA nucleotidyltransferase (CCA-adding enzyme)
LRKEEYCDTSRIPTIAIGTPLEDAYRRDLTINSIFYNINTNTIEDFTMRGVDDLRQGLIRTPLDPLETFREDPLRILRSVRFATRFNFQMDDRIVTAARDPDIGLFLSRKVSRERIGVEFLKMAQSNDFKRAIDILEQMNIINCIFNIEGDNSEYMRTQKHRSIDEFNDKLFLIQLPQVV